MNSVLVSFVFSSCIINEFLNTHSKFILRPSSNVEISCSESNTNELEQRIVVWWMKSSTSFECLTINCSNFLSNINVRKLWYYFSKIWGIMARRETKTIIVYWLGIRVRNNTSLVSRFPILARFCITLVSFIPLISIGNFWGWNLHFPRNRRNLLYLKQSVPVISVNKSPLTRAATINRNIGYPRFRTHGSVSVRLVQISVRFRFLFFFTINVVKRDILTGKSYKI